MRSVIRHNGGRKLTYIERNESLDGFDTEKIDNEQKNVDEKVYSTRYIQMKAFVL